MSSSFAVYANDFNSGAIILSLNQSVPPRSDFGANHFEAAQSIPPSGPNSVLLPSHPNTPPQILDHQIINAFYEPQQLPVRHYQRSDMAMRGDVDYQTPEPLFPINPLLVHSATMGIAHGSGLAAANRLIPVYRVRSSTYNAEPQPLVDSIIVNNVPPSYPDYMGNLGVGSTTTIAEEIPTLAKHYHTLDENMNRTTTFTNVNCDGSERDPSRDVIGTNTNANGNECSMFCREFDGDTVHWRCKFSGCQYTLRSKRDTERHCLNLRHGGCREHKCEFCGKAFVRKDTLKRHVKETLLVATSTVNAA
ncbi:hypothetical protein JOM56_008005 [Amanita muscaria]